MTEKIKVALIGFGGMGHFHASCYKNQKNAELVALCDIDKSQFEKLEAEINVGSSGKADLSKVGKYLSYEELIQKADFDMLDICLPCHLHAEYAIRALKDGYHVLCEKPMARTPALADRMIRAARENNRLLMIAQCLRFGPAFNFLKDAYNTKKYGSLLRLDMRRNGSLPTQKWYRDPARSGGALLDLHLHDTDFINYMLGVPDAVITFGVVRDTGGIDDLITNYIYKNGPRVSSEGSWCRTSWYCSIVAVFRKATVELLGNTVKVARPDQPVEEIKLEKDTDYYYNEIAYFADCIRKNKLPEQCLPESTRDSIRIAAAEERSARAGGRKVFLKK
ncbi:MAG: Glucose--fructose oxidoreductase precursor [Lentisphaerae bacterium ADurb.Bin242]|nr:MAG: Glucose--fructose oxidoreductase precursor [Lentisphaerae bacterium ADurb.Bin242]